MLKLIINIKTNCVFAKKNQLHKKKLNEVKFVVKGKLKKHQQRRAS